MSTRKRAEDLERVRAHYATQSDEEIAHEAEVLAGLDRGLSPYEAIQQAGDKHPTEAIHFQVDNIEERLDRCVYYFALLREVKSSGNASTAGPTHEERSTP